MTYWLPVRNDSGLALLADGLARMGQQPVDESSSRLYLRRVFRDAERPIPGRD